MTKRPDRRSSRRRPAASSLLCAALLALAACGGPSGSASTALPDATLESVDGGTPLALADLRGPALVNLWATWCIPCRAELPALQAVAGDTSAGVAVIGINVGDDPASIARYLEELSVTFPNFVDPDGTVQTAFSVAGLPATLAVDAEGKVVEVYQGTLDEDGFRALADQAMTESTNS